MSFIEDLKELFQKETKINAKSFKKRVDNLFSSVYLTVLSVVLGVAFAFSIDGTRTIYSELFSGQMQFSLNHFFPLISYLMILNTWLAYAWFFFVFAWPPMIIDKILPFLLGLFLILPTFFYKFAPLFFIMQAGFLFMALFGMRNSYKNISPKLFDENDHGKFTCCLLEYTYRCSSIKNIRIMAWIFLFQGIVLFFLNKSGTIAFRLFENQDFFNWILILATSVSSFVALLYFNWLYFRENIYFWRTLIIHFGRGDIILRHVSSGLKNFISKRSEEFIKRVKDKKCKDCEIKINIDEDLNDKYKNKKKHLKEIEKTMDNAIKT